MKWANKKQFFLENITLDKFEKVSFIYIIKYPEIKKKITKYSKKNYLTIENLIDIFCYIYIYLNNFHFSDIFENISFNIISNIWLLINKQYISRIECERVWDSILTIIMFSYNKFVIKTMTHKYKQYHMWPNLNFINTCFWLFYLRQN